MGFLRVAGTNRVLKEGQVLFKAGDKSDGMYLIRAGELRVYLEQNGKEVSLATVGAGGMIGEMALFDSQPRSASVKVVKEAEITLITTDEFGKLMKQIPKWFVGLMASLSARLRQTNERLQKLETGLSSKAIPFQNAVRIINILILLWHKDGQKDGKDVTVQKLEVEKTLIEVFNEDKEKLKQLFEVLVKEKILTTRVDGYKNVVYALSSRAVLNQLALFIPTFVKANLKRPHLSPDALNILRALEQLVISSPYDTVTASMPELLKEGKKQGYPTTTWEEVIKVFQTTGEEVRLVKTSSGPGLKTSKKDCATALKHHEVLAALFKSGLA